jgi:hypothetical protein
MSAMAVIASEATQSGAAQVAYAEVGLLRRFAPRNDGAEQDD